MRVQVVAVGTRMPGWVEAGVEEYSRRLPRQLKPDWNEIPLPRRGNEGDASKLRQREAELILKKLSPSEKVVALEVDGKPWSTTDLAARLETWQMEGDDIAFLIGGPDGLAPSCLERADLRWSLGAITLPHPLVRIILAEQLYRAWTITVNHPYHRE